MSSFKKKFYQAIDRFLRHWKMEAYLLIFIEIIVGSAVSVASFLLFVKFAREVLEKEGVHLDMAISQWVYSLRSPFVTEMMKSVSYIGGEGLFLMTFGIIFFLLVKHHKREAVVFACATLIGQFLNVIIKFLLKIPRPEIHPLVVESFYSFPSGHAMNSFIFFASLSYLLFHFTRKKRLSLLLTFLFTGMVLLIGFSRIYLGVHYPTDIVAGYVAGFWWFITVLVLDKTFHFYRLFKSTKQ